MALGHWRVRWLALRVLRSFVSIAGKTPLGEPIVVAGSDRLVLRRGTKTFWLAERCPSCGVETASDDLDAHIGMCPGPRRAPETARSDRRTIKTRDIRAPVRRTPARRPKRESYQRPTPPVRRAPAPRPKRESHQRPTPPARARQKSRVGRRRRTGGVWSGRSRRLIIIYSYAFFLLASLVFLIVMCLLLVLWVDSLTSGSGG